MSPATPPVLTPIIQNRSVQTAGMGLATVVVGSEIYEHGVTPSTVADGILLTGGWTYVGGRWYPSSPAPVSAVETTLSRGAYLRQKYAHYTQEQRVARIEELAMGNRVLREAGVPREYISSALQSFEPGTITSRVVGNCEYGLRFYGGESRALSPYLSPTFPLGNVRQLSSLPPGNSLESLIQYRIKPGITVLEGRVRAKFDQPGGGRQIYVPDYRNNLLPAN